MTVSLSKTSPAQWKYISEGGATIVFSYKGPLHGIFTGKVLRLTKTSRDGPRELSRLSDDQPDLSVTFQQNIFSRLLDSSYLLDLQVVALQTDWVEAFSLHHEPFRPQERRSISMIDCSRRTGILAPDLVGGLSCAVEVKPKWGFLPNSIHLSPESKPIKTQTCRTCMHAHLKQTEGVIAATQFCPLDLFSGSKERVETAIEGLWDSWIQSNGSINNLRIFNYGKMVLPSDELTLRAWSRETLSLPTDSPLTSIKSKFIDTLIPQILSTPLLSRISTLQRALDPLDCEGLAKLAEESSGADLTQPTMEDWVSFIDAFLSPKHQKHSAFSPSSLRYYTLAYLLSATFKDCSLIIPLRRCPGDTESRHIKIIDLEIKSIDRVPDWMKLDEKIVKEYAKLETSMRKTCIEGRSEHWTTQIVSETISLSAVSQS